MPLEALVSDGMPVPFKDCPKCKKPFDPFLRGQVARFAWWGLRKRIWCLICRACKEIVGHEEIPLPRTHREAVR